MISVPDFGVINLVKGTLDEVELLYDRAIDRHLRVAVTGLRRSGKTVFITSLVHHLTDGHGLPFVKAIDEGRYLGARTVPPGPGVRAFPIEQFRSDLSRDPPVWPKPTDTLSRLRLELRFRTSHLLWRQIQSLQSLTLEIVDYPGEWLLDLPLLEASFESFSEDAIARARRGSRAALAAPWLAAVEAATQSAAPDPGIVRELAERYRSFLLACQRELGLSIVQPGRFTSPGELEGSPLLDFCPLPPGEGGPGTLRYLMADRFRRYRDEVVRGFYEQHFSRFDRQIVLVDMLSSLNRGPEHFEDTQEALQLIMRSFRYGRGAMLGRLFAPRIDRLLIAVSKSDHVAPSQHAAMKQLLELMVAPAVRGARHEGITPEILALASLRCTDVVKTEHHGQVLSCVRGRLRDEERETVLFPGEIPPDLPEPEDWRSGRFRFYDFAPRRLVSGRPHQHIRLDQAIEYLVGDKLG